MHIVTRDIPGRLDQVRISLQMEPTFSILSEDERHAVAARLFAQSDVIIGCWPDQDGIDGYAVAILKGFKFTQGATKPNRRSAQFPCLQSEVDAMNLSALYGDDRKERKRNMRGICARS